MKKGSIGIITMGCSKNIVDSERLLNQLKLNKFEVIDDPNEAETLLINTCGFIADAKEESINTILGAAQLKSIDKIKRLIVFGCLSQRYKEDLIKEIPEVDIFFGVEEYDKILKELSGDVNKELLSDRSITTPHHYAYFKISEGCNNPCSFCAIPLIRGQHVSYPIENLVDEAKNLAARGVKELITIAQDTTYYGLDIYKKRRLAELLNRVSEVDGIEWIRLLYTYPSHFPMDVLDVMKTNPKICNYLDIPLQHISDEMLKSMRRGITSAETKNLIEKIKTTVPDITLRTTFIVGYPGETEKDFTELLDFITEYKFDRIGAFTYSPEEDTGSFGLGDPVPDEEKEKRLAELMNTQADISLAKNEKLVGREMKVIIDSAEGDYYIARSSRETPEVDGEIFIPVDNELELGEFTTVQIYDCTEHDLFAKPLGGDAIQ